MKILLLCEGQNEEMLMNILLEMDVLVFERGDLIGLRPYHARQIDSPFMKSTLKLYGKPVKILRIGDTLNDDLRIPTDLSEIVSAKEVYKYCTKPELEMLLILSEGLERKYRRSRKKPKEFAKENIRYNKKYYDQSSRFFAEYYGGKNVRKLAEALKKYKRYKRHGRKELYLADLLK